MDSMIIQIKKVIFLFLFLLKCINLLPQNAKADGYKGIWFTIEQSSEYGYKYSGGLGAYTADHIPVAIYSPEVRKTFFVYGGTTHQDEKHLLIMISYYDHEKRQVPKPVVVYDKKGVDDPHDNASLAIDDRGFIWVFISGRNISRPGFIYKSKEPYNIDDFEQVYETVMTYPQPWWIKGKGFIHLFTKYTAPNTYGRELYWSTSQDGKTWEPDQKLAAMGGHYQISNRRENKIVTAFNYHPGGNADKRTNIYFVQTDDMGKTWKSVTGKTVHTPLTDIHSQTLVFECENKGKLVYLNDINFDKDGNPLILAIISNHFQPGPQGNPREWMIFHWKNKQWKAVKVCESTHNYDMGSLYVDGNQWLIIAPTDAGPQKYGTGGEMVLWETTDEGETWKQLKITQNSNRNHSYARRPLNAHDDFYAFWADGNADKFSQSKLYFSNKKGNKLWQLPYNMDTDFASPIPLNNTTTGRQPFGVNLAGAEFDEKNMPGEYNKHYTYPTAKELDYFKSKGLTLIRLPFKWERLQPELYGKLNDNELSCLKTFVSAAEDRQMCVILDLHNYGRRFVNGTKWIIGENGLTVDHFADLWKRIAFEMKEYTNIYGYGLMNEPHDLKESVTWFEMAQAAINAIREIDGKTTIVVAGDDWSSAERWIEKSDTLKYLMDPGDNLLFEAHVYFDKDASGSYKKSYDDEECFPEKGIERVRPFAQWLKENGRKGFIGEYGVPHNDKRWLETMDIFLAYLQKEGINATYWAAGPWWGNYTLSIHPNNGNNRPQMKIVEKYLFTTDSNTNDWIDTALLHAEQQARLLAGEMGKRPDQLPRSANNKGQLITSSSDWWCSGFFPGVLWLLYENNPENKDLLNHAVSLTNRLDKEQYNTSTHDLGFMLYCSYGKAFQITKNDSYKPVLLNAANSLSSRYNPVVGCIQSWGAGNKWRYPVIIDNMMNLELLMWAYRESGDEKFKNRATTHANNTLLNHFRPDNSSYHVLSYDPETGEVTFKGTDQGYSDSSAWARGQAWGLYGYTMMYRETGDSTYLNQAHRIARFLLDHPNLPEDKIPYWDFDLPQIPNTLRDASSAAIIASALLELSLFSNKAAKEEYLAVAEKQLRVLASPEYTAEIGTNGFFILKHGVGNVPQNSEIDAPLTYSDYYYIEALLRYKKIRNQ
jgi:rhamnogalacturonyl hydrolase YesR